MGTVTACLGAVPLSIMHLEEDHWHFRFWGLQTQISAPHAESRWQELSASIIVWTNSSKKSLSIYLSIYPSIHLSIIYLSSVYHLLLVPFLWRTLMNKISITCSAGGKEETLISCPPPPPCLHPFAPLDRRGRMDWKPRNNTKLIVTDGLVKFFRSQSSQA